MHLNLRVCGCTDAPASLAAKFEEAEEVVPRISDLCSFAGIHGQLPQVEAAEVHKMEVLLLTK